VRIYPHSAGPITCPPGGKQERNGSAKGVKRCFAGYADKSAPTSKTNSGTKTRKTGKISIIHKHSPIVTRYCV